MADFGLFTLELKFLASLEVEDVVSHDSSRVVLDEEFLQSRAKSRNEDELKVRSRERERRELASFPSVLGAVVGV